jgi:transitional endoplasmic reticulum ATPase
VPTTKRNTQNTEPVDPWTEEAGQQQLESVSEMLAQYGRDRVTTIEKIERRSDGGTKVALPKTMELEEARDTINEKIESLADTYEFSATFLCRPPDGAWNFNQLLAKIWDFPVGKAVRSFFGDQPPQIIRVQVSPKKRINVPWGQLFFAPWKTTFHLNAVHHPEYGPALQVEAYGAKKFEDDITNFFALFEDFLKENSIYAGQAMRGVTAEPEFYDPYEVDRSIVAYSEDNWGELQAHVYGLIENADLIREGNTEGFEVVDPEGNAVIDEETGKPKREFTHIKLSNNVLLSGDNGGGKTMACAIAGQYCLEFGHTFVEAKWNEPLTQVLRFTQALHKPALVVVEDVEYLFRNLDAMNSLLDEFDGMRSKGFEVTLLMTTNHIEEIPKSMKGGHRIDHTITIGGLDEPGVKRLIDGHIPSSQRLDLDYGALYQAYEGMMPAFIVRSLEDVVKYSIIRTKKLGQPLATEDFVRAAKALRPSIEMHQMSTDRPPKPALDEALGALVEQALQRHMVDLSDGEIMVRS